MSDTTSDASTGSTALSRINLDLVEKVILISLFGFFASRMLFAYIDTGNFMNLLQLVNEGAVLVFIIIRRQTNTISQRPIDWVLGFGGTCLPLMLIPAAGTAVLPMAICAGLLLAGFVIQMWAKFTLRRSFGIVAANRGVKTSGPYRFVRHPMYAGYIISQGAFLLSGPSVWNASVLALGWALQIGRILSEERILKQDESYADLCRSVRSRLIPGLF